MSSQKFGFAVPFLSRAWKPSCRSLNRYQHCPLRSHLAYPTVRVAFFSCPVVEHDLTPSTSSYSGYSGGCIQVHNYLSQGCLPYAKTWAWQQFLLRRRLEYRRRRREQEQTDSNTETQNYRDSHDHNRDCILILEHAPVYTLGRGADETFLTFLNDATDGDSNRCDEVLARLSRKARGPGTARLSLDRRIEEELHMLGNVTDEQVVEVLSRSACPVMAPNGVPIFRVERGGEVTFHGPSQLVVYPLLDLQRPPFQPDLHWYLRMIEEVILQTLKYYEIEGHRDAINTGVWVVNNDSSNSTARSSASLSSNKVAAVGISSSRWITTHGFALNVDPDLDYFDTSIILPCGIEGRGVTSIAEILRSKNQPVPTVEQVADVVTLKLQEVFGVEIID